MMKKTVAIVLAILFAFSPLAGGFGLQAFAEDWIESPILPFPPADPSLEGVLVYSFDREKMTATVIGFTDERALTLLIPESVSEGGSVYTVAAIASAALRAPALQTVIIAETVTTIADFAFDGCPALEEVWFEGDEEKFASVAIGTGNAPLADAEKFYDACMKSDGPQYLHTYDDHTDKDCNACGKERVLLQNVVTGDLDGVNGVDMDDAIYLLFYTFYPEQYPLNQSGDFDRDGDTDMDDAVYLLFHTYFPDRYPIA